ncbi:MAG: hypothetical protein MRZ68_11385 [Lachnospira sp.]|nr:hypothetical protein [Lachnospira sp.]
MASKLTKDDVIQYSFRLNLNIESHLQIHQTLQILNKKSRGAKSRFILDSLTAGVLKLNNSESEDVLNPDDEYVTRGEMKRNNDRLIQEFSADIMARIISQTALISGAQVITTPNVAQATNTDTKQMETEDVLDDAVEEMAQLYADWGNE